MLIFKISEAIKNPLTKVNEIGILTLKTYKTEGELVDKSILTNPFEIKAG